jgi:hypothetical protein
MHARIRDKDGELRLTYQPRFDPQSPLTTHRNAPPREKQVEAASWP